jgi:hypothetical protein
MFGAAARSCGGIPCNVPDSWEDQGTNPGAFVLLFAVDLLWDVTPPRSDRTLNDGASNTGVTSRHCPSPRKPHYSGVLV